MTQVNFNNSENLNPQTPAAPLADNLKVNLPQQVAKLLGREEVVSDILAALASANSVHMQLVGIGGVGKTAICRHVAHHLSGDFGDVVWVNCQADLMEQLSNFVAPSYKVKIEDPTTWLYELTEVINNRQKPTVVFLDNLEAEQVANAEFRQLKRLNCHIVATSRQTFSDQFSQVFDINALHKNTCVDLFSQYYQGDIDNDKALQNLLKLAGYHTLTIELLAKIATNGLFSIDELLGKVTQSGFDLSDWNIAITGDHSGVEAKQLQLQEHLSKLFRLDDLSEYQQQLLYCLSILPPIAYEGRNELMPWLDVEGTTLTNLADKGWLQRHKNKFSLHPVIASIAQKDVKIDDSVVFEFIGRFDKNIRPNNNEHWVEKAHYLAQLEAINEYLDGLTINERELDDYDIALANIMCSEAKIHLVYINYDKAIKLYQLALSLYHHVHGKNHQAVSGCIGNLAQVFYEKGDYRQALKCCKQNLDMVMEMYGAEHQQTAISLNNIAGACYKLQNYQQAYDYQQQALAIDKHTLTPLNPALALTYYNLAKICYRLNDHVQALPLILKARFIYAKSLVDGHPDNKDCQNRLDDIVTALGGYEQNEALIEQIEAELDEEYDGIEIGRE